MPAYFEMSLQFLRKDLYPGFMTDFDAHLEEAGLAFFDGFWEDRGLSQKEIAAWNQKKLEKDFCLGPTTHRSRDYKQTLYRFGDYSEVRGFWMNQYPTKFSSRIVVSSINLLLDNNGTTYSSSISDT